MKYASETRLIVGASGRDLTTWPVHTADTDLTIIENDEAIGKLSGCRAVVATRDINMRMGALAFGVEAVKIVGHWTESEA